MIRLVTALARIGLVVAAIAASVPMIAFAQATEPAIESVPTEAEAEELNASPTGDENDPGDDNRFNDLRSELLDDRAAHIDRWLAVIAIVLTFFGIVVAVAGVLGFRRFREIEAAAKSGVATVTQIVETSKRHLKEIESNRETSNEILRDMNAETAADNPQEATQVVANVRENPGASLIDKAIADAVSLQQQNKKDDAVKKWRAIVDIVEVRDNELAARAWVSISYLLRENPTVALNASDRAIHLKPDHATAYNNRGNAKRLLERYDEAIADFDMAIHLKPNYVKTYINRGRAKAALGRHNEAIADYDRAVRVKSKFAEHTYINRGLSKAVLGFKDEARKDFEIALKLARNANNVEIIAQAEQALRDLDEAEDS